MLRAVRVNILSSSCFYKYLTGVTRCYAAQTFSPAIRLFWAIYLLAGSSKSKSKTSFASLTSCWMVSFAPFSLIRLIHETSTFSSAHSDISQAVPLPRSKGLWHSVWTSCDFFSGLLLAFASQKFVGDVRHGRH